MDRHGKYHGEKRMLGTNLDKLSPFLCQYSRTYYCRVIVRVKGFIGECSEYLALSSSIYSIEVKSNQGNKETRLGTAGVLRV
jgi:hypothetical protein